MTTVRHLDHVQQALRDVGADALWVHPSVDLRYLTGLDLLSVERPTGLVIPASGGLRGFESTAEWAGLRPWLPDHLPAIGAFHAIDGLWVATGHEGAGVALGPVSGRLVAQALCGEPVVLDLTPFAPDRFAR